MRWNDYLLARENSFEQFWSEYLAGGVHEILFVTGSGFDPRMITALRAVIQAGGAGRRDCAVLEFNEGTGSASRRQDDRRDANITMVEGLVGSSGVVDRRPIYMWSQDGRRRTGSRNAANVFNLPEQLSAYTDVVVDISALPRTLYFPLVAKFLTMFDDWHGEGKPPNLHVVVSESPVLDRAIISEGLDDEASYVFPFSGDVDLEATADLPRVWLPMLGEGKGGYFRRIHDLVRPDEIVPALPFPSNDPRRSDNLIVEYRVPLLEQLQLEPGSFLYVPENNPFAAYRAIMDTVSSFQETLAPLGGCKVVLSALSSKLISVGVLLAAYELKRSRQSVGVAHVYANGYRVEGDLGDVHNDPVLYSAWLTGECYAAPE